MQRKAFCVSMYLGNEFLSYFISKFTKKLETQNTLRS